MTVAADCWWFELDRRRGGVRELEGLEVVVALAFCCIKNVLMMAELRGVVVLLVLGRLIGTDRANKMLLGL